LAWQKAVSEQISVSDIEKVSNHLNYGWPLASPELLAKIAPKITRPLTPRKAGRPKKVDPN